MRQEKTVIDRATFNQNNFDLLRLFAATQVAVHHGVTHLGVAGSVPGPVHWVLEMFPGVPIFFFISGFLISKSFEVNSRLSEFATNRLLRIYPALFACFFGSLISVLAIGYLSTVSVPPAQFVAWIVSQLTILQFWNPEFMRGYGTGVLNGSLWTITVELQFYVLVPCLYFVLGRLGRERAAMRWGFVSLVVIASLSAFTLISDGDEGDFLKKLLGVTFMPWFWMFLGGVLAQRCFSTIYLAVAGRAWVFIAIYLGLAYLGNAYFGWRTGNHMHPALFVSLSLAVLSTAYTLPRLANRILHRNDISYGVYIWHMPVVNALLYLGIANTVASFGIMLAATVTIATLSWLFVEQPAMRLKRHPLNPLYRGKQGDAKNLAGEK